MQNGVGTIDSDYTGELIIPLINLGEKDYVVKNNDRIAQILLARCERINWQEREEIDKGEERTATDPVRPSRCVPTGMAKILPAKPVTP